MVEDGVGFGRDPSGLGPSSAITSGRSTPRSGRSSTGRPVSSQASQNASVNGRTTLGGRKAMMLMRLRAAHWARSTEPTPYHSGDGGCCTGARTIDAFATLWKRPSCERTSEVRPSIRISYASSNIAGVSLGSIP